MKALNNMTITGNTVEIALTQGKTCTINLKDLNKVYDKRWCAAKTNNHFYAVTSVKQEDGKWKLVYMHKLLMNTPTGMDTDHINHDGLDNTRDNLRICTRSENLRNCKSFKNSTSRFKGVCWAKTMNKWNANIWEGRKNRNLGYFECEIAAAQAYNRAAIEAFGDFAHINTSKTLPMSQERGA